MELELSDYVFIESYEEPRIEQKDGEMIVLNRQSGLIKKEDWENIERYMAVSLKQGDRHDDIVIDNLMSKTPSFKMQDKDLQRVKGAREWRTLQRQTDDFYGLRCIFSLLVEDNNGEQVTEKAEAKMGIVGWGIVES